MLLVTAGGEILPVHLWSQRGYIKCWVTNSENSPLVRDGGGSCDVYSAVLISLKNIFFYILNFYPLVIFLFLMFSC